MFIDITTPLSAKTPTWRNEQPFQLKPIKTFDQDGSNVTRITIGSHSGTHVDAPRHFLRGGKTIETLPLDVLIGPCRVLHLRKTEPIARADLEQHNIVKGERLLIRANDGLLDTSRFQKEFVSIAADAAQFLVQQNIALLGVDYLSVERSGTPGHPTHTALLSSGIVIVEGLYLKHVEPGEYELCCLPLKILGGDGAPARACLRRQAVLQKGSKDAC